MKQRFNIGWILLVASGFSVGCGDVEWNWDTSWWKQNHRVVRPSQNQPKSKGSQSATATTHPANHGPEPATTGRHPAPSPVEPDEDGSAQAAATTIRPFYHLYLVPSSKSQDESDRRGNRVVLQHGAPRPCGAVLEMLFVPLGRSGSGDETYLIFEQPDEFDAAMHFAPQLDFASSTKAGSSAWERGIRSLLAATEKGAVVEHDLVVRCERAFADAMHDPNLGPEGQWASAVLAGKLMADYLYDYDRARTYFTKAVKLATPDSVEMMTAEWWMADTFVQQGRKRDADAAYDEILNRFTSLYPKSHIVERSFAILKKSKKK